MAVCDYCAHGDHEVPKVQRCECLCHGDTRVVGLASRTLRRFLVLAVFAASAFAQELPNPDHIKLIQEAQERERAIARRIEYQISRAEKPKPAPRPARVLTDGERRELREALERFVRENPGRLVILWPEVR